MSLPEQPSSATIQGRPVPVAGAPLLLLAMVLLGTAGGLASTSMARPITGPPTLAALVLPGHLVESKCGCVDDQLPGDTAFVLGLFHVEERSEIRRLLDEWLNLPPPCC